MGGATRSVKAAKAIRPRIPKQVGLREKLREHGSDAHAFTMVKQKALAFIRDRELERAALHAKGRAGTATAKDVKTLWERYHLRVVPLAAVGR